MKRISKALRNARNHTVLPATHTLIDDIDEWNRPSWHYSNCKESA